MQQRPARIKPAGTPDRNAGTRRAWHPTPCARTRETRSAVSPRAERGGGPNSRRRIGPDRQHPRRAGALSGPRHRAANERTWAKVRRAKPDRAMATKPGRAGDGVPANGEPGNRDRTNVLRLDSRAATRPRATVGRPGTGEGPSKPDGSARPAGPAMELTAGAARAGLPPPTKRPRTLTSGGGTTAHHNQPPLVGCGPFRTAAADGPATVRIADLDPDTETTGSCDGSGGTGRPRPRTAVV